MQPPSLTYRAIKEGFLKIEKEGKDLTIILTTFASEKWFFYEQFDCLAAGIQTQFKNIINLFSHLNEIESEMFMFDESTLSFSSKVEKDFAHRLQMVQQQIKSPEGQSEKEQYKKQEATLEMLSKMCKRFEERIRAKDVIISEMDENYLRKEQGWMQKISANSQQLKTFQSRLLQMSQQIEMEKSLRKQLSEQLSLREMELDSLHQKMGQIQTVNLEQTHQIKQLKQIHAIHEAALKKQEQSHNATKQALKYALERPKEPVIQSLSLASYEMSYDMSYEIDQKIESYQTTKQVDFEYSQLRVSGLKELVSRGWILLITINLYENYIQDEGLAILTSMDWPHLKNLGLGKNELNKLNWDVNHLSKLEKLSLQQNCLRQLPEDMSNIKNLRILDISGNKFKTIPSQLIAFKMVLQIWIGNNYIPDLETSPIYSQLQNKFHKDIHQRH